jgi:pimeloyl-ACP methyl ester carboxylesterase
MESSTRTWEAGVSSAEAGSLGYLRATSGSPVIVLLHGWPQSSWAWREVIPRLDGYDVIAFDLPGIGASAPSENGYGKRALAELVFRALRGLGVHEDVTVVGHDMGALVAYAFARMYPAWTRSLVILDQALPGVGGWDEFSLAYASWHLGFHRDLHGSEGLADLVVGGRERIYFRRHIDRFAAQPEAVTDHDIDVYARAYQPVARLRAGFELFRALPVDVADNQSESGVFPVPTLLAFGEYSQASLLASVSEGLDLLGVGDVAAVTVDDCGHWVAEEKPAALAGLIREFTARAEGAGS